MKKQLKKCLSVLLCMVLICAAGSMVRAVDPIIDPVLAFQPDKIKQILLLNEEDGVIILGRKLGHNAVMFVDENDVGAYYSFAPVNNLPTSWTKIKELAFAGTPGEIKPITNVQPSLVREIRDKRTGIIDGKHYNRNIIFSVDRRYAEKAHYLAEEQVAAPLNWSLLGSFLINGSFQCDDFSSQVLMGAGVAYKASFAPNLSYMREASLESIRERIDVLSKDIDAHLQEEVEKELARQAALQYSMMYNVFCPVDVQIFDADGELLKTVHTDDTDLVLLDGLIAGAEGDAKFVFIAQDKLADYQVKLAATDEGTMSIVAITTGNGNAGGVTAFEDVPLVKNGSFDLTAEKEAARLFATQDDVRVSKIAPDIAMICHTPGDLSGDGTVDSTDARMVLQSEVELITLTEAQETVADVTHDNKIDSSDARLILQYDVGLVTAI